MTDRHIVVTGAAGFLGFHIARALAARPNTSLICVDNLSRGADDNYYRALCELPNVQRFDIDLCDPAKVALLPTNVDFVYHMAALNGTQNFYERPMDVIRSCTLPTIHLVDHFGKATSPITCFVYAGTSEAYASTVTRFEWPVPTDETVPLSIDGTDNPRWSYAASKLHGEIVVNQASRAMGFPAVVVRFHNAYGPRMGDKHVIPDFMERMKAGQYELFGHSDTRSFLYVDDAVRATVMVAESQTEGVNTINIGGTEELTMAELGRRMLDIRDIDAEIILHPSPQGSVKRRAPDTSKLKALTGFSERISLDAGLALTAQFYIDAVLPPPSEPYLV